MNTLNLVNEFALLFAVATPLVVLFAMNLFLLLEGERGTLMFPSTDWTPSQAPRERHNVPRDEPANDEHFRRAA
ncbi:hypothetical protein BWI17_04570 [Betaproteobacteria bacterium GR16-43]|nr:hypothetical protein BWI17_04570 [Betaproteobacteria bacterium GR16-43]